MLGIKTHLSAAQMCALLCLPWLSPCTASAAGARPRAVQTRFEYYFGTSEGDPRAEVTLAPKVMLYGTTYSKATNGYGTVFAFNRSTGLETTLHAFNGTDGAYPMAGVTRGADGMLYGATANGGPDGPGGYGTLFKINPANGKFTQIYAFTGDRDGGDPMATLVFDASGTYLYGSTSTLSGPGTIFKFNIKTKELTTLYHFTGHLDGAQMYNCPFTWDATGTILYGTSDTAGQYKQGVLFAFDTTTAALVPLHQFTGKTDGSGLANGLTLSSAGVLYGTTTNGGAGGKDAAGTIYSYDTKANFFTTLYTFTGTQQGASPNNGLAFDDQGNLYGGTLSGGSAGGGTLYEFNPGSAIVQVLFNFDANNAASGASPYGRLVFDGRHSFWGTNGASRYNLGTLFKLVTN
jgi:uncharacterized repeat protein (TIGR03803 family)